MDLGWLVRQYGGGDKESSLGPTQSWLDCGIMSLPVTSDGQSREPGERSVLCSHAEVCGIVGSDRAHEDPARGNLLPVISCSIAS